ncbi:MAG: NAD(P)-dependent oxidoreductase [Mesorhizobium sp.]|nr:MAG: NAD(P)-dependent oxidoreductase [Mesorhizobium sp.]
MSAGAVLVTGAAGLVGNAVRVMLDQAGRDVIPVDRIAATEEGRPIVQCDVTEVHRLHAVVQGRQLAGVIHCGAFSGPMVARDNPPAMVAVNIVGTANVLELARIHAASRFVFCSSTSAYGVTELELVPEDVPLRPTTLYGASKVSGEQLVAVYRSQFGLDGVSLRLSWVYGPRRTTDCIIREMVTDALAGKPTHLAFGSNFHRQFIHVEDAARALVTALDQPNLPRDTYNVTGGSYLTFPEIADAVRAVLPSADISIAEGDDPVDDRQTRFDIAAVERDLRFSPRIALVDGIRSYADWLGKKSAGERL